MEASNFERLGHDGPQITPAVAMPRARTMPLWVVAQVGGMVMTVALVGGLLIQPAGTLNVLWNAVVPILPAIFVLNPRIWRNVCPLATANQLTGDRFGKLRLSPEMTRRLGLLGIVLFFLMVPARRFVFNTDGLALAVTVVAVAALALLLGVAFATRAGFCNTLCPVLSVERLYGQRPLLSVANARCATCSLCTGAGCIDLAPEKSVVQTLGHARKSSRWLMTPFGAFSAGFPGFVVGYFTTVDGPLSTAPGVYGHVLLWTALSLVITIVAVSLFRLGFQSTILVLGGLAVGLYYWYASPSITDGVGLPIGATTVLRVTTLSFVAFWLVRGLWATTQPARSAAHA